MNFNEIVERSVELRKRYHRLEREYQRKEWTLEEDARAFLADADLVGRLTVDMQGSRHKEGEKASELDYKLGECMWWLIVLAERMDVDINDAIKQFLSSTEKSLKDNS